MTRRHRIGASCRLLKTKITLLESLEFVIQKMFQGTKTLDMKRTLLENPIFCSPEDELSEVHNLIERAKAAHKPLIISL